MSSRNYKTYSADGLIVVFEKSLTDTNVLKEIVHEISFRIKAFNKLAPYLKKAEAIIAANAQVPTSGLRQDNESDVSITSQSEALVEKARNKPAVKDSRSQITNIKLEDLKLRSLEYSLLKAEGVEDLKDLVQKTEKDLLKIPNFRKSSLTKINALLEDYGLTLRMKLDIRGGSNVIQNIPSGVSDINLSSIEQKFLAKAIIANNVKHGISSSELKQDNNSIGLEAVKFQRAIADQLINQSVENLRPKNKNIMLEDLGLRAREYHCLKMAGVVDLNTLIQKTGIELLKLPNFGRNSLEGVLETLKVHGFTLGMTLSDSEGGKGALKALPIAAQNLEIEYVNIGNREYKRFKTAGIHDLGTLVTKTELDLLKMPGFGKRSLFQVVEALAALNLTLNMPSSSVSWVVSGPSLSDQNYINYPIENLGLPLKTYNCLIKNQIKDIKTLLLNTERDLLKIPRLGRTAQAQIVEVIKRSGMKFGVGSMVHWEDYCEDAYPVKLGFSSEQASIEFLPRNFDSTEKFNISLSNFIDQYADVLESPKDKLIYLKRIVSKKIDLPTLEDIGKELGVTRERVRQVEKRLILKLIKELIGGCIIAQRYKVDPNFSAFWGRAISSFEGLEELSLNEFQKNLSSVWGMSSQDIMKHINFICVIFTRKVKSSLATQHKDLGQDLFEITARFQSIPDIKLSHFRLGERTQNYLSKSNIFTVYEFLDAAYSRPRLSPPMQFVVKTLLSVQIEMRGKVMWVDFFSKNNLQPIERKILSSRHIFLSELYNILFDSLGKIKAPEHSQEIFRLRTSKHARTRKTLSSVSERLYGTTKKQPHISKDQSVFLEKLHKIFVGRDYTEANFSLSDELINYFKESTEIHQLAEGDFEKFVYLLRLRFGVNDLDLNTATTLWTILDGYSPLRYFHLSTGEVRKRKSKKQSKLVSTKIKLSGFRDIY